MADPVQELVDTLAALREDVSRIERQNAGLTGAVQAAQKAVERIGSTVGADAGKAAADKVGPVAADLRTALSDAAAAAQEARTAADRTGRGIPRPLAAIALLCLLASLGGAFLLGWYYGPGDWRACPADRLVVDQKTGGAWCKLN